MKERNLPRAILLTPSDGALAVARSLARHRVDTHMLLDSPNSWVGMTRWATEHRVGRLPDHEDDWIEKLIELGETGEGVLISCNDRTTELVAQRRAEIPAVLRSFESGTSAHLALMDKSSLYEIAEAAGVPYPRTVTVGDEAQLDRAVEEATFPCLIKPVHSHRWRAVFGERRVIIVDDPEELRREAAPALEAGLDLLVTEHVPGPDEHLEGAYTVRRADGAYTLVCGRRKVRMQPPGYGAAAIIESVDVPETLELSRRLLDATDFFGVSSAEFKLHARTGERYLIEVNVRLPQAWGLTEAARTDGSWRLYSTLAGLDLGPQPPQRVGVRCVVPSLELRSAPTHLAERKLSIREVIGGYRGVRGFSGLTWRDPKPILSLGWTHVKWVLGHLTRRLLRREP